VPATDEEIALVVSVTGAFESSGDPYVAVSGDFDGMGISCGVLQWNIGSHSLQPLVQAVGQDLVRHAMPNYGADLWAACNAPAEQGRAIVRAWQTQTTLSAAVVEELRRLLDSPEMRRVQFARIGATAQRADVLARDWAQARGQAKRTLQELVWFFDVLTQNGSMRGIGYADVRAFVAERSEVGATEHICDWLQRAPAEWWGREDCGKNSALWQAPQPAESFDLFVLSYLRARVAGSERARGIVMNRKGTIAARRGYVNGTYWDFSGTF
jgi:hypothetical protein